MADDTFEASWLEFTKYLQMPDGAPPAREELDSSRRIFYAGILCAWKKVMSIEGLTKQQHRDLLRALDVELEAFMRDTFAQAGYQFPFNAELQ